MGGQNGEVDKVVARLATKAHGVVARRELLAAGLSERQVDRRLERGALIVEFPGVYRVGHRARGSASSFTEERNGRARAVYAAAGYRPDGEARESDFEGAPLRELRLVKAL